MTIGELREKLRDYPDHYSVNVCAKTMTGTYTEGQVASIQHMPTSKIIILEADYKSDFGGN